MEKTNLQSVSYEDLKSEIEKREEELNSIPKPLESPDFLRLIDTVQRFIQALSNNDYDDNWKDYIYEEAIRAIYGDNDKFRKWINKRVH